LNIVSPVVISLSFLPTISVNGLLLKSIDRKVLLAKIYLSLLSLIYIAKNSLASTIEIILLANISLIEWCLESSSISVSNVLNDLFNFKFLYFKIAQYIPKNISKIIIM